MDEPTTEIVPTTTKQSTLPTQKKRSSDLMTQEEREKELAEKKESLAKPNRQQEIIDQEFVYFEKCPIRYIVTKDDNGNEIRGYKDKNGTTPENHFNTLNKLTATQDILLHEDIVNSALLAQPTNQPSDKKLNIVSQVLADYEPKNSLEAKLCLQAHTLYTQGMRYLDMAQKADMINHSEFFMKNAIKLLRLHNETVESLNRQRRGTEQRIIVQHQNVQVNDGGQAIVGSQLIAGGGVKSKMNEVIP